MRAKIRAFQTNLVLLTRSNEIDSRKFIAWNMEESTPVEVLSEIQTTKISIENQKKMFEHPLEDGSSVVDYSILESKKVNMQIYVSNDDTETLNELERLYIEGTRLRLRAENKILNNMVISAEPFEISSNMLDKNLYSVTFKEAQYVTPQYVAMPRVKRKSDTSRVNTGVKQVKEVKKQSWLSSLFYGGKT